MKAPLAFLIGIVLLVCFTASLLFIRLEATFASSEFYREQLREADAYGFALRVLPKEVMNEAFARSPELESRLARLDLGEDDLAALLERTLPPEWLDEQVGGLLDVFVPYMAGKSDGFAYTLRFDDRVDAAAVALTAVLDESAVYDVAPEMLGEEIYRQANERGDLERFGIEETNVSEAFARVFPREWTKARTEEAIYDIAPYLAGRADGFAVKITLTDRAGLALTEFEAIFDRVGGYTLLYEEAVRVGARRVAAAMSRAHGDGSLDESDIAPIIREAFPEAWARARAKEIVGAYGDFIAGDTDILRIDVDIEGGRRAFSSGMADLARKNWDATTAEQTETTALSIIPQRLRVATTDPATALETVIVESATEPLRQFSEVAREDIAYTDADLRDYLSAEFGSSAADGLETYRRAAADGLRITEADFVALMQDSLRPDDFETVWSVRAWYARLSALLPLAIALTIGALALIGWLLGNGWSRLIWASAALAVVSALTLVPVILVWGMLIRPQSSALSQTGDGGLAAEGGVVSISNILNSFFAGLAYMSFISLIVALCVFSFAVIMRQRSRFEIGGSRARRRYYS